MEDLQIDRVKELIGKIQSLKEREREISVLRDESFNIFKILRLSNSEVGLHSRFIFELLNPYGAHEKGEIYLRLFLQMFQNNLIKEKFGSLINLKVIEVKNEKYLGLVDFNLEEGGSLDIYIETSEFIIGIENKIHAGIGYKQLKRYSKYLKSINKNSFLLYLSLHGNIAVGQGLELNKDYYAISYRDFIIPWLETCHQHSSDNPSIRETIKQYINTIKGLTGQLTNHKMNNELENLLLKNYDTALTIFKAFGNVRTLKARKVYEELEKKINESLEDTEFLPVKIDQKALDKVYNSFSIRNKNWVDGLNIIFEGKDTLLEGFTHGLFFEKCPEIDFKNKMNGKISLKNVYKVGQDNLWINPVSGRYGNLIMALEKNDDINVLAEDVKDYILTVVQQLEPDAKKITEAFK